MAARIVIPARRILQYARTRLHVSCYRFTRASLSLHLPTLDSIHPHIYNEQRIDRRTHTPRHAPMSTQHATIERYDARDHMWGYVTQFDRYGSVYDWSRAAWSHVLGADDHSASVHYRTNL